MFKPGSIRKIVVKDFVTYSYCELYPGPNLNMIIGPNGTGKSTLVAAIILGLGGTPKTVGRGKKISEYVKHDCQEANIDIFLQSDSDKILKISRKFDLQDKSMWKFNNNLVRFNQIQEVITKFHIQVDNLCQFLPQDRVQDFARLNKQQLLQQTQVALCREDLVEKQKLLIEKHRLEVQTRKSLEENEKKIREATEANVCLEGKIKGFRIKKAYLEEIENINRKIAWIEYKEAEKEIKIVRKDENEALQSLNRLGDIRKPLESKIGKLKKRMLDIKTDSVQLNAKVRSVKQHVADKVVQVDLVKDRIRNINCDMVNTISTIEHGLEELERLEKKLSDAKLNCHDKLQQNEENKTKKINLERSLNKLSEQYRALEQKHDELIALQGHTEAQFESQKRQIQNFENIRHQRLEQLSRLDHNVFTAVKWLEKNKHLFQKPVYEPIILELNVLDVRNAKFLENVIQMRDRLAFTCTSKEDMRLLIQKLRNELKLSVNILFSDDTKEDLMKYQPAMPIERLRRFGFFTFLKTLISGPDAILGFLCKTYSIHNIPIGDASTDGCYEEVPNAFRLFFSDKYRYSVSISRYSGEKTSNQSQIRSDNTFSISLDVIQLEKSKNNLKELAQKLEKVKEHSGLYKSQMDTLFQSREQCRKSLAEINGQFQQVDHLQKNVQHIQRQIGELQKVSYDTEKIKEQAQQNIVKEVSKLKQYPENLINQLNSLTTLTTNSKLNFVKTKLLQHRIVAIEEELNKTNQSYERTEVLFNEIKRKRIKLSNELDFALKRAKELSENHAPEDPGFRKYLVKFNKLTSDLDKLQEQKEEICSRVSCLNTADENELQEYENRIELIKRIEHEMQRSSVSLDSLTREVEELKEEWLGPVQEFLGKINGKFSNAFKVMGCAGDVSLFTGDETVDYSQYGISIKVTYRNGMPLQELNQITQSGGERAVATAIYMLSLQELTAVPFRCVDEINQGMDAKNERRIFKFLFEVTKSSLNSSQYFLITPKLLPNLDYSEDTTVHIIHNGAFVAADCKWSTSSLCNPQRYFI